MKKLIKGINISIYNKQFFN